jgi:hypothetical protein
VTIEKGKRCKISEINVFDSGREEIRMIVCLKAINYENKGVIKKK